MPSFIDPIESSLDTIEPPTTANGIDHMINGVNEHNGTTNGKEATGKDEDKFFSSYEPIAIIGCGMRLPGGVSTSEALWQLLNGKNEGRCEVPHDRYNIDAFYGPGKQGHVCTKYG